MVAGFEEPIGPLADLTELLYVVGLHQASLEYREDVSVTAEDISLFLMSRYGAKCSPDQVKEIILKDVGGKRVDKKDDADRTVQSTDKETTAREISSYLTSKFGINIQPEDLQDMMKKQGEEDAHPRSSKVMQDYQSAMDLHKEQGTEANSSQVAKQSEEEASGKIDLVELAAMMWIPEFQKVALLQQEGQTEGLHCFNFAANAMIHDLASFGSNEMPDLEIKPSLMRDLFLRYGETTLAGDEELIAEMVQAARSGLGEDEKALFDTNTFGKALTQDIGQYNTNHEESISTNWDDVFGKDKGPPATGAGFVEKQTAPSIDMAAHTYFCRIQMIVNWLFFVFTYFAYIYYEVPSLTKECAKFQYQSSWPDNKTQSGCNIVYSILDWLVTFASISVAGVLFVGLGSVGNDLKKSNLLLSLFSAVFLVGLTIYFPLRYGILIEGQEPLAFTRIVALVMGFMSTIARLRLLLMANMKNEGDKKAEFPCTVLRAEGMIKKAGAYKIGQMQENAFSVHETLTESSAIRSHFGMALANFAKLDPQHRSRFHGDCCRKDIMSGRTAFQDGILLSGRFLAGNLAQFLLCVVICGFGYSYTRYVRDNWIPLEEREDKIASNLEMIITLAADQSLVLEAVDGCLRVFTLFLLRVLYFLDNAGMLRLDCILLGTFLQKFCENAFFDEEDDGDFACSLFTNAPEELCESMDPLFRPTTPLGKAVPIDDVASIINTASLIEPVAKTVSQAMSGNIAAQVNHLYPRHRSMVVIPVAVGAGVATLCALVTTCLFLPSISATTLKLRKGVIPSVCDPERRLLYTYGADSGSFVFGSMFWGLLASSLLVGGLIAFILFISMWQVTAFLMMQGVALLIGISVTLLLKWLLRRTRRVKLYSGFYRNSPLKANFSDLLNESFNFATSVAFAIIRMAKLLGLAALYVGRIDTKFLDPNANKYLGGRLYIDIFPEYFIADILSTEAHRHPYIERLGVLYLYKLKYGSEFATRAGSAWRLLFVTALMPWLQKYRIASRQKENESEPPPEGGASNKPDADGDKGEVRSA